jgi:hypothetical protein
VKFKLEAGAEIDLLTSKELQAELDAFRRDMLHQLRRGPLPRTLVGSVTLSAAGVGQIDLGAPGLGDAWDVRNVGVTPADPTAAVMAAVVTLWGGVQAGATLSPFKWKDRNPSGTIPANSPWSSRQWTLRQDENLLVNISGGTASATVIAVAQVLEGTPAEIYGRDLS